MVIDWLFCNNTQHGDIICQGKHNHMVTVLSWILFGPGTHPRCAASYAETSSASCDRITKHHTAAPPTAHSCNLILGCERRVPRECVAYWQQGMGRQSICVAYWQQHRALRMSEIAPCSCCPGPESTCFFSGQLVRENRSQIYESRQKGAKEDCYL
jgi:hypothetical protein